MIAYCYYIRTDIYILINSIGGVQDDDCEKFFILREVNCVLYGSVDSLWLRNF